MLIEEYYRESIKQNFPSLTMLIDYLVYEKQILNMDDEEEKLSYYLQDRFHNKMNEYLTEYGKTWNKERVGSA